MPGAVNICANQSCGHNRFGKRCTFCNREFAFTFSPFILLDLNVEGAISFIEKVVSTFYDPPPYLIATDRYPCSMAHTEVLYGGADAFLEKPIDAEEVLAVINAALRRADRLAHPKPIRSAPKIERSALKIDPLRRSVSIDGRPVELTVKEFDILQLGRHLLSCIF